MRLTPRTIEDPSDASYAALARGRDEHLLYATPEYLDFLRRILPGSRLVVLGAESGGELATAMPLFVHTDPDCGTVVNSLPFFGSHGGALLAPGLAEPDEAIRFLLGELEALAEACGAASATVVSNPLAPHTAVYGAWERCTFTGTRIGQIAPLPDPAPGPEAVREALMTAYHSKTRNMVRKALSSGLTVRVDNGPKALRLLCELHGAAMAAMGSDAAKPWPVFEALAAALAPGAGRDVLLAELDGRAVAALLVLYGNACAEYFVPATREGFRELQPMTLLVHEAMARAALLGMRRFNFGGTWESQHGVYRFKSRFGARDHPYHHYTMLLDRALLAQPRERLLAAHPWYFTVPFEALETAPGEGGDAG